MASNLPWSHDAGLDRTCVLDPCPVEPLLLRPDEVARRVSISRAAVYRLIASGTIPSVRLGGSRRVSQTQLSQLTRASSWRRADLTETADVKCSDVRHTARQHHGWHRQTRVGTTSDLGVP